MADSKTNNGSPMERISQLQAQIEQIKGAAIEELKQKRAGLEAELSEVTAELERLTGKPAEGQGGKRARKEFKPKKLVALSELKELLNAAPEKTISIRKENFDLTNIKTLAHVNPTLLRLGGKAPWPTVTLLK